MDSARPFRAFVSYCHADAVFAARLQRRLEGYRLPRRLADRVAPLPGQAQGRIGPIFRDRADLSAAEDLSAAVREAIAASSALVVVASPDAAGSRWVALEIKLFRELHPGAPVLVALARGEPETSLPDALRTEGIEPLAADFRREGDGKRLAFLKIVAGLTGIPFDALVQRDAQRQIRRVTAITLGAVVLVLVMSALLVVARHAQAEAERQRVEAEHRRADAEGLVEFMLTNLRGRLKGGADLEVMKTVNERALKYFDDQGDPQHLSDDSNLLRAQVLSALADDDVNRDDLVSASEKIADAYRSTSGVLKRRPAYARAIFGHAQSEFWVGLIAWRRNDRPTATRHWRAYFERAQELAAIEPGQVRSLMEQGYAAGDLCELSLSGEYDLKAAESECAASIHFEQEALAKQESIVAHIPAALSATERDTLNTTLESLANRHGWLARVQIASGDGRAALKSREIEASLLDALLADQPWNLEYALRRTWPDIGIADAWILLGSPKKAALKLRECLDRRRAVFDRNSEDERVTETQFRLQLFLAKALRLAGRGYSADLAQANQLESKLASSSPEAAQNARKIRISIFPQPGR